jgi:hypothetical protein
MTFIYTPNTPQAAHFPADDQGPMNENFQYLNSFGSRDHQFTGNTTNVNDGIHKQVTLAAQSTPGFTGGTAVLYGNTANAATQLFFNNSLTNAQLTTAIAGVPAISAGPPLQGISFLPGGLLIQWGFANNGTNLVTYPIAFKSGGVGPVVTVSYQNNVALNIAAATVVPNNSTPNMSFQLLIPAGSVNLPFNWIAIGQAT